MDHAPRTPRAEALAPMKDPLRAAVGPIAARSPSP